MSLFIEALGYALAPALVFLGNTAIILLALWYACEGYVWRFYGLMILASMILLFVLRPMLGV